MNPFKKLLATAALGLLAAVAVFPTLAASSAASSASDSLATSVGSLSGSIEKSSNASSKATGVAAGDYRIIDVAAAPDRPGMVRMNLQPFGDAARGEAFVMVVPGHAVEQAGLARGDTVSAKLRPYGIEFSGGTVKQPFFLVLLDDWYRDLDSHAVVL